MHADLELLGARIRAARQARGMTLAELAAAADMSTSTLSRLESGKRQANLELLIPISRRLGIRLDDLVHPTAPDPRVRRDTEERSGMRITPLTPEDSPVQTFRVTYPPTAELPQLRMHDGYEWCYVLTGKLRLRVGEHDLELSPGEAAEFDTRTPHAMSAAGGDPATVLSIFNQSGERMHTRLGEAGAAPSAGKSATES
ncbi:helix-turn-helix domain-containing protein [Gulosibacter sediminis]|uniref:helix-turn-helix domain-containing protein n=1 Tax=Gulosibacter sediminis TaxID=1729695 RepID=UPI0024AD2122|nr:XRE family transcriptional regulator [Gulosibacter sediminis]